MKYGTINVPAIMLNKRGDDTMAFFDYNHDGKKDWKDNAREYYLYNKMQKDEKKKEQEKQKREKEESPPEGGIDAGCGTVFLCFLFLFLMIQLAIWTNSL